MTWGKDGAWGSCRLRLDNLTDVDITAVADLDLLQYDLASDRWVNRTISTILDGTYLKLDGSNANSNIDIGAYDFTTTGVISTPNINRAATQNLELFDAPVSIGNSDPGRHFIINRHAMEGDDYLDFYVNATRQSIISASTELQIATANIFRINVASYTQTITPIRIAFDSVAMLFGASQDGSIQYVDGVGLEIIDATTGTITFGDDNLTTTGEINLGASPTYDNACTLRVSQGAGMVADFHAIGGGDDTYIHLGHTDVNGVGYGHKVFYVGSGSGDANYLEIRSDNSAAVGGAGITHMRYHQASLQSINYDDMTMDGDQKVLFRDSAIYINSIDDGHLDLTADISIDLNAPDVAVSGDLTVSGYISGAWDIFQDFDTTLTYSSGLVATIATTDGASTKTLTLTRNADNQISAIACVIT